MADQDNGKSTRKGDWQGSNRIQRLTLLASFLAICAPLALGVWIYNFSEHPLSEAQQELSYIQSRLGKIEEQSKEMINNLTIIEKSVSSRLKAIDLLHKMRPRIRSRIVKVFRHNKIPTKYYVTYSLENTGGYASLYKLIKGCIVDQAGTFSPSYFSNACIRSSGTGVDSTDRRGFSNLSVGEKISGILLLEDKTGLQIDDVIYLEFMIISDKTLSDMALKTANQDLKLKIKSNFFTSSSSYYLTITSPPSCGENAWCAE